MGFTLPEVLTVLLKCGMVADDTFQQGHRKAQIRHLVSTLTHPFPEPWETKEVLVYLWVLWGTGWPTKLYLLVDFWGVYGPPALQALFRVLRTELQTGPRTLFKRHLPLPHQYKCLHIIYQQYMRCTVMYMFNIFLKHPKEYNLWII